MGILERIKEIELEISRTQKNKATTTHLGLLKSQLARLRTQLLMPSAGSADAGGHGGFSVQKSGDGRGALIGFPSVGKSSLLNAVTDTKSEAAAYEFTTLTCIPGNLVINDTKIQMLDLPGIIEGKGSWIWFVFPPTIHMWCFIHWSQVLVVERDEVAKSSL
jgi:ribosome-interacting GTPase 1